MYDLACAPPHAPPGRPMAPAEWALYVAGYRMALTVALKAMDAAGERYQLYLRTRRLETRRQREEFDHDAD